MLEQCRNNSKQRRNNVATLCCAKNRRCKSSRVPSPSDPTALFAFQQGVLVPSDVRVQGGLGGGGNASPSKEGLPLFFVKLFFFLIVFF